jgi:hypothetical protein
LSSSKTPTSLSCPISGPSRIECSINIPKGFLNESIEEEASSFIKKLLYTKELVTTKELYK